MHEAPLGNKGYAIFDGAVLEVFSAELDSRRFHVAQIERAFIESKKHGDGKLEIHVARAKFTWPIDADQMPAAASLIDAVAGAITV